MRIATLLIVALFVQAPAGWDATYKRGQQLILDGKVADAIKLYEAAVKAAPAFDAAHYALADAHDTAALEAAVRGPSQDAAKRQHFEAAAIHFRQVLAGKGEYAQLAVGHLMRLYGEDGLDKPDEVIVFARQYAQISPTSPIGHITLARALKKAGQEAAGTAVLLRARTAVAADDSLLAPAIIDYVVQTQNASTADMKALLDYADRVVDRELKAYPTDRGLIIAKGASAMFRAQRLETDPARKRALDAEASRMMDRLYEMRDKTPVETPPAPPGFAEPPGYAAAHTQAEGMMGRKQYSAAAGVYEKFVKSNPEFVAAHYLRLQALVLAGQSAVIDSSLHVARQSIPAAPEVRQMAASYAFDIVNANKSLASVDAKKILAGAMLLLDDALKTKPDYWEAVIYKSVVTRARVKFETDPAVIKSLTAEADRLRAQAEAMHKKSGG